MQIYDSIVTAANDVDRLLIKQEDAFPAHVLAALAPYAQRMGSDVDLLVNFTEAVYANQKDVPKQAIELAASTANLIDDAGYHERLGGRARGIAFALRRESGEKAGEGRAWPKKVDDPDVKAIFLPPEPAPEPVKAPGGDA
jgi:hypothetical protein